MHLPVSTPCARPQSLSATLRDSSRLSSQRCVSLQGIAEVRVAGPRAERRAGLAGRAARRDVRGRRCGAGGPGGVVAGRTENSLRSFLYMPYMYPISRAPTPMSPAGTSVSVPMCRKSSAMNDCERRGGHLGSLTCSRGEGKVVCAQWQPPQKPRGGACNHAGRVVAPSGEITPGRSA